MPPRLSVVIPVYNEGESVTPTLDTVFAALPEDAEVLAVYDMPEDTTVPVLERYAATEPRLRPLPTRTDRPAP